MHVDVARRQWSKANTKKWKGGGDILTIRQQRWLVWSVHLTRVPQAAWSADEICSHKHRVFMEEWRETEVMTDLVNNVLADERLMIFYLFWFWSTIHWKSVCLLNNRATCEDIGSKTTTTKKKDNYPIIIIPVIVGEAKTVARPIDFIFAGGANRRLAAAVAKLWTKLRLRSTISINLLRWHD